MVETGRKLDERHSRSSQPENELSTALVSLEEREREREGTEREKEKKEEEKIEKKGERENDLDPGSSWWRRKKGKKRKKERKEERQKGRKKTSRSSFIVNLSIETCSSGRLERAEAESSRERGQ